MAKKIMTSDLYTHVYVNGNSDTQRLLDQLSRERQNKDDEIVRLKARLESIDNAYRATMEYFHEVGEQPDKAKKIYDAWVDGFPLETVLKDG